MKDKKDRSKRLEYLTKEKEKQEERKDFYIQQIDELRSVLNSNEQAIKYNKGWILFHEKAIEEHTRKINTASNLVEKSDQEKKLQFHKEQIKEHHKKNIKYHNKERQAIQKEIDLFESGMNRCEEQIRFLNEKIDENRS